MSISAEPWREPVRGGHPNEGDLALSGAEQLQALLSGATPTPPMGRLTGMRLVDAARGEATFELPLSGWLRASDGRIPPGPLVMPVDAAMACAIMTELPERTGLTTSELTLRRLRPIPEAGCLRSHARVIDPTGPLALAEAEMRDDTGALIAHAISTCFLMPDLPVHSDWDAARDPIAEPGAPDPWRRDPPPWPSPDGEPPPLHRLTGLRIGAARGGQATGILPATRWLCAPPPGRIQGGAVAMLAEAAITAAAGSAAPPQMPFTAVQLQVQYLRPLAADGREARATAGVVNAGRRFILATAEVRDAGDRLIATASGSCITGELLATG